MDMFLSVHLQKQYLLITLLINLIILFKWTLLERSLRSLLRSLVIKSLIDNIFVERLGLSVTHSRFFLTFFFNFDDFSKFVSFWRNISAKTQQFYLWFVKKIWERVHIDLNKNSVQTGCVSVDLKALERLLGWI
jgi:hypothetical protein